MATSNIVLFCVEWCNILYNKKTDILKSISFNFSFLFFFITFSENEHNRCVND